MLYTVQLNSFHFIIYIVYQCDLPPLRSNCWEAPGRDSHPGHGDSEAVTLPLDHHTYLKNCNVNGEPVQFLIAPSSGTQDDVAHWYIEPLSVTLSRSEFEFDKFMWRRMVSARGGYRSGHEFFFLKLSLFALFKTQIALATTFSAMLCDYALSRCLIVDTAKKACR